MCVGWEGEVGVRFALGEGVGCGDDDSDGGDGDGDDGDGDDGDVDYNTVIGRYRRAWKE